MPVPAGPGKLITVIVPQGRGMALLKQLHDRGVVRASLGTARAPFTVARRKGGITRTESYSVEKDILQVVVEPGEADEAFRFLYDAVGIGAAAGAFMFQGPLAQLTPFSLPTDVPPS